MSLEQASFQTGDKKTFVDADYAVLGCTLAVSVAIGIFYAIKDRNRNTTDEYLLGGRNMHPILVALSLNASFVSSFALLGNPVEVYVNGIMYLWISVGFFITCFGAGHIFLPVFYRLGITSVFQICAMSIWLYGPSLALNAVTDLHLWGSVIGVGTVCVVYTCVGGMKAVLWADSLQMVIMYAGVLTMLIKGSSVQGGFQNAWNIAKENGRTVLYEVDPRFRHSIWSLVIGGGLLWCNIFGTNQAQVQRAMALVPLFMMDLLWEIPGLPGVFLSAVFSASLSTLSSGLNALAAVTLEDFVRPMCCNGLSSSRATWCAKGLVILYGFIALALAILVANIGGLILQMAIALFGMLTGPLFGLFSLGVLFPWANKWGGLTGLLTSVALMLWIGIGTMINEVSVAPKLYINTEGCNWNVSNKTPPTPVPQPPPDVTDPSIFDKYSGLDKLYSVSYLWYTALATLTVIVVGLIVSFIIGPTDPKTLNPKLIVPVFYICLPGLPEGIRRKLRSGVRHGKGHPVSALSPHQDVNIPHMTESQHEMALNTDHTDIASSMYLSTIGRGHGDVGYDTGVGTRL